MLNANWAWFLVVLAASALTYVASAIALAGCVAIRLRFWPLLATQFASSFINRISPSNVGGMALNARFLQKSGVEPAAGVTAVGVNALAGAVVHLALIAIFFTLAGRRLAGTFKLPSPGKVLLVLGIIAAVVGLILATGRARRFAARTILPRVRSSLANLREVARRPGKLALLVGGSALVTLAYIGGVVASVLAFRRPGQHRRDRCGLPGRRGDRDGVRHAGRRRYLRGRADQPPDRHPGQRRGPRRDHLPAGYLLAAGGARLGRPAPAAAPRSHLMPSSWVGRGRGPRRHRWLSQPDGKNQQVDNHRVGGALAGDCEDLPGTG